MSGMRGFDAAQREYDNRTPPDDGPTECDICNGYGHAPDAAFLATRLRRLFDHFALPLPAFAADDWRLLSIAGSAIGMLLTRLETAKPAAWVNGSELEGKANATIACTAERPDGLDYDTPLYTTRGVKTSSNDQQGN